MLGWPFACSGAMYAGDPTIAPDTVSWTSPISRAMPKSVITTRSGASSTLAGLRSRCTIPAWWATRSASRIAMPMAATRSTGRLPCVRMASASEPPRTYSITINGAPLCSTTSYTVTMPGWFRRPAARASRIARWLIPIRCASSSPGGSSSSLIATSRSMSSSWPSQTRPIPPVPITRVSR